MSVQTIIPNSIERLCEEALKSTINNANKLVLQERFKLGKGYCEKEEFHNSMIRDIASSSNSELVCHVRNIIENGPEECENKNYNYNGL